MTFLPAFLIFSKRGNPNRARRDFERRQALIGHVNLMCGPGELAFSTDYGRLLFVSRAGDMLAFAQWRGARHEVIPIHPHELMRARLGVGPMERQAYMPDPHHPLPLTCVIIERTGGPPLSIVLGDPQTAARWAQIANSVAARYSGGHSTMRVN